MSNTTTTTTTAAKKQFTFGVNELMKTQLAEFRLDFTRPAAVKNAPAVPMSEKECLEVLFKVASDRRFKTVEVIGENGAQVIDSDGLPEFQTLDLIGDAWEEIKLRDHADENTAKTPLDKDLILTRKLCKMLQSSEEELEDSLAKVRARHAALALL